MLYEAACGKRPFENMPIPELLDAHVYEAPVRPRDINPDLTPAFESLILRTLSKTPDERYENAPQMINAMELALQGVLQIPAPDWLDVCEDDSVTTEWHRAVERISEEKSVRMVAMFKRLFRSGVYDLCVIGSVSSKQSTWIPTTTSP